jgi:hypothetical protein
MASITSGQMADCDWLRSTFSSPLFSPTGGPLSKILKQMHAFQNKTAKQTETAASNLMGSQ